MVKVKDGWAVAGSGRWPARLQKHDDMTMHDCMMMMMDDDDEMAVCTYIRHVHLEVHI